MTDHKLTYQNEAENYDRLVSYEDYHGRLLPSIRKIIPLEGKDILELGAGTGRLSTLLLPFSRKMIALDLSHAMLSIAQRKLQKMGGMNWLLGAGDHRHLPMADGCMDVIIAGWSICYLVDWYRSTWKTELTLAFNEMDRVLRRQGTIILIETQGTGYETPHPPEHLVEYFAFLSNSGFEKTWLRTDYQFEDLDSAERITRFFFGKNLADQVKKNNWVILPECTGIWWKIIS